MKIILLSLFFFCFITLFSQTENSKNRYSKINWMTYELNTQNKPLWQKPIIPLVFGITAISINQSPLKQNIQNTTRKPFNGFTTSLDDYIQYAPIALMYSADAFKLKAEHSVWNQTKYLFISEVTTGGIIQLLKHSLKIERPDKSANNSFPSGHTGQAFVAAQVLHNEFKNTQPILAYSGYLFATSTGTLRIVNNKHWLPDVLMAASISILITNLVYHFEPLKNWNPFKTKKSDLYLRAYPTFNDQYSGLTIKINL
jgi:hypothetical protein